MEETEFRHQPLIDPDAALPERNYAQWIHLAGLLGSILMVFSGGMSVPIALIAVLIMWVNKRETSPFIDDHGREATNFQISLLIYSLLLIPLFFLFCIGALLAIPLAVLAVVGTIRGSQAASRGEYYRYPACIRLIS